MAFIGSPQFSSAGINSIGVNPNAAAGALSDPQMREVFLGQIASAVIVKAILSFDDPRTSAVSGNPPQQSSGVSNAPPQQSSGVSNNPPQMSSSGAPNNQIGGDVNLTSQGGFSAGGGFRALGGGAPFGLSAVGTTTLNSNGYQTSGGLSVGGLSANVGVKLNGGGLSFSGGVQRAQVGQGIVGSQVGPRIVGP